MRIRSEETRSPEVGEFVKKGDADIMKRALRNWPVHLTSGRKKWFCLTTWYLEKSTCMAG